jgi:hypothetical protein
VRQLQLSSCTRARPGAARAQGPRRRTYRTGRAPRPLGREGLSAAVSRGCQVSTATIVRGELHAPHARPHPCLSTHRSEAHGPSGGPLGANCVCKLTSGSDRIVDAVLLTERPWPRPRATLHPAPKLFASASGLRLAFASSKPRHTHVGALKQEHSNERRGESAPQQAHSQAVMRDMRTRVNDDKLLLQHGTRKGRSYKRLASETPARAHCTIRPSKLNRCARSAPRMHGGRVPANGHAACPHWERLGLGPLGPRRAGRKQLSHWDVYAIARSTTPSLQIPGRVGKSAPAPKEGADRSTRTAEVRASRRPQPRLLRSSPRDPTAEGGRVRKQLCAPRKMPACSAHPIRNIRGHTERYVLKHVMLCTDHGRSLNARDMAGPLPGCTAWHGMGQSPTPAQSPPSPASLGGL